jgi:hypothetical protein
MIRLSVVIGQQCRSLGLQKSRNYWASAMRLVVLIDLVELQLN